MAKYRGMSANDGLLVIDRAQHGDVPAIHRIYAHYVETSLATFEIQAPSQLEMFTRWATVCQAGYPYLVARRGSRVLGYAYCSAYRLRPAYQRTVENSVYIAHDCVRQGAGKALLMALVQRCASAGFRQMVAVIGDSANDSSIALHTSVGFEPVGTLKNVGHKFQRWVDTVLMQLALNPQNASNLGDKT